jgi:hypothetical protein
MNGNTQVTSVVTFAAQARPLDYYIGTASCFVDSLT